MNSTLRIFRQLRPLSHACCALLLASGLSGSLRAVTAAAAPADDLAHFVTRDQDRLMADGKEFRFISVNLPDSSQIISNYQFDGDFNPTRYRLPDDFELRDCVRTVRQMGGRVMRTFVITCRREPQAGFAFNVGPLPTVPNEEALRVLDRLLQICHEEGVRLLIPLVAYGSNVRGDWHTYGEDFWQIGSPGNLRFKDVLRQLLNRTNTLTGKLYRDDPAIFAWQTGNELVIGDDAGRRAWLHDIAAHIKSLDRNHLLVDGRNKPGDVYGKYEEFITDKNIDAVSYHTYVNLPEADSPAGTLQLIRNQLRGKTPLIVSEIAMYTKPAALRALLDELTADGTVGGNWWALRFHNRDGGFYKHSDKNSEFEDLNWPGFANKNDLPSTIDRERELLDIVSDYAGRIRSLPPFAPPAPTAPNLLPIRDPGHISWQGATGASAYTLQRAETASGPWTTIASDLGDHLIAYAAQYCDREAVIGRYYFYQVIAHNAAGTSSASNIVGPVAVERHWLVDELFDLKLAAPESANLRVDQAYAHSVYLEDIAVAVRADPARAAELIYRCPTAIREFTATVYEAQVTPKVFVRAPNNSRREIQPEISSYDGGKRRRLSVRLGGQESEIMVELSAKAAKDQAIGRVEIATAASE